jgi:hypothetical protein
LNAFSQIPTNGLIGWYPFTGSANDLSPSANNGTVYNATLTTDRFGTINSAYYFDGIDDYITISNLPTDYTKYTYCGWVKTSNITQENIGVILQDGILPNNKLISSFGLHINIPAKYGGRLRNSSGILEAAPSTNLIDTLWKFITVTWDGDSLRFYSNGVLQSKTIASNNSPFSNRLLIGCAYVNDNLGYYYEGKIDDVRLYNIALNSDEIVQLYNDGLCKEMITVTDTLIINTNVTGYNPISYQNTIKVFPNPTNDHITIDFGSNYSTLNGYTVKITNSLGQTVYTTAIIDQQTMVDLSTWTGNGIYFMHLIDAQSQTIDIRKIVIK